VAFPLGIAGHRPRREGGAGSLEISGALAECRTLLITLSVYCCVGLSSGPGTGGSEARTALFGVPFVARHGTEWSVGQRVSVGQL